MSKSQDQETARLANNAAANALAERLRQASAMAHIPKTALVMKDANDMHALVKAAAKDTRELVFAVEDKISADEHKALCKYLLEIDAMELRARIVYARALALHVSSSPNLSKIGEKIGEIEKKLEELLAEIKSAPTSSLIALPNGSDVKGA